MNDYWQYRVLKRIFVTRQWRFIAWQTPPANFVICEKKLKINVDGAATSNHGNLALGGLCRDEGRLVVWIHWESWMWNCS